MPDLYKYPSTPHLPFSPGATESDIWCLPEQFEGEEVVVTEKMDGENFTGYSDGYCHARSLDSRHHPSRSWAKNKWNEVYHNLPDGWRVAAENTYAEHSIRYENLPSYFLAFSIWNDENVCLSWEDTEEWCEIIGLEHVPVLYKGEFDLDKVIEIFEDTDFDHHEGIVVRKAGSFHYDDFQSNIGKAVRPNHVQTDEHWMHQEVVPNGLKEGD